MIQLQDKHQPPEDVMVQVPWTFYTRETGYELYRGAELICSDTKGAVGDMAFGLFSWLDTMAATPAGRTLGILGGGFAVQPRLLRHIGWDVIAIYELRPQVIAYLQDIVGTWPEVQIIQGDWHLTIPDAAQYTTLIEDVTGTEPIENLLPHVQSGGLLLPAGLVKA